MLGDRVFAAGRVNRLPERFAGEDVMGKAEPTLEEQCASKGMRMTDQRRVIAQVIEASADHPDVEELHRRAADIDPKISLSTVYRTVNLFEEAGLVTKHDFKDGRARFEPIPDEHHDHLIDIRSGKVIEFRNEEIEAIQELIAKRLGYRLVDHRLELYAVPSAPKDRPKE
jgi:Fur family ferric uptake transcriptional regulator